MSPPASQFVSLPGGFAPNTTLVRGEGSPVVFLHGPFGQEWSGFLNDVAVQHTVFAPAHPGAVEPNDLHQLDNLWDLMLYYDDVLAALGLDLDIEAVCMGAQGIDRVVDTRRADRFEPAAEGQQIRICRRRARMQRQAAQKLCR